MAEDSGDVGAGSSFSKSLSKKLGPLPGYAWLGLGVGGFLIYHKMKTGSWLGSGSSSGAGPVPAGTTDTTLGTPTPGIGGVVGGGGGTPGGSAGTFYDPSPQLSAIDQELQALLAAQASPQSNGQQVPVYYSPGYANQAQIDAAGPHAVLFSGEIPTAVTPYHANAVGTNEFSAPTPSGYYSAPAVGFAASPSSDPFGNTWLEQQIQSANLSGYKPYVPQPVAHAPAPSGAIVGRGGGGRRALAL